MIYLQDNPCCANRLSRSTSRTGCSAHWGSSPGQAFIWAHANRLIQANDLDMIYLSGLAMVPPGVLGTHTYLDRSYSEIYPDKSQDAEGCAAFSSSSPSPANIGSHCTRKRPARSMRAVNSVTCSPTPVAPSSTTPT